MDRREFFRRGMGRVAKEVVQHADAQISERASRWIRPPFAISEIEFLLACTRCNACIDACPHDVIFPLAASNGADVMNTPALDLLNAACHLCADWPCVTTCETAALQIPNFEAEPEKELPKDNELDVIIPLPNLAHIEIQTSSCLPYNGPECGACAGACPVEGALQWHAERPSINQQLCTGCALCRQACITEPKSILISKNRVE